MRVRALKNISPWVQIEFIKIGHNQNSNYVIKTFIISFPPSLIITWPVAIQARQTLCSQKARYFVILSPFSSMALPRAILNQEKGTPVLPNIDRVAPKGWSRKALR